MKNNVLHRFALQDLRKHKKDLIWISITIFVVAMITMLVTLTTPIFFNKAYLEYQKNNGTYDYYSYFENLDEIKDFKFMVDNQYLSLNDSKVQSCVKLQAGYTQNGESIGAIKGNMSVLSTHIKAGRAPENQNEVAIKSQVFKTWGYDYKLNSVITIAYVSNEKSYVGEFNVVGILEDTGDLDILSSQLPVESYCVYLDLEYGKTIQNADTSNIHRYVTFDDFSLSKEGIAVMTLLIQIVICIISISLLYGLTLSSFENREKDYTLLRSIGVTKRQIYYIILIQSLLLSLIPILSSLLIVYIISQIIPQVYNLSIPIGFDIMEMSWTIFLVILIVFFSYFAPARSSVKNSLNGAFEGQEFQYFYYRYKKLHQMRPFYLGWRQLIALKKKMIIKIFLISLTVIFSIRFISNPVITDFTQENNQKEVMEKGLTIEFIPLEDKILDQEDFKQLKPIQSIYFYQFIDSQEFENNSSFHKDINYPTLYCENDDLIKKYQMQALKSNEIALSQSYLQQNGIETKCGEMIEFLGDNYKLSYILDTDYDLMAIMNNQDYYQFMNMQQLAKAVIRFDSIQQKTQMYIDNAKILQNLNYKYYKSDPSINDISTNEPKSVLFDLTQFSSALIALVVAVIYIYQFIFELLKQKSDIGTYQLLGLRKIEIWKIYFYKSLFTNVVGLVLGIAYVYADIYVKYQSFGIEKVLYSSQMLLSTFGFAIFIVLGIIVISLIPLLSITNKSGLENKKINE